LPSAAACPRVSSSTILLGGPLDLAIDLAAVIPDAMMHFINKDQPRR